MGLVLLAVTVETLAQLVEEAGVTHTELEAGLTVLELAERLEARMVVRRDFYATMRVADTIPAPLDEEPPSSR